jgi:CRISPR-associated protein Cmr2
MTLAASKSIRGSEREPQNGIKCSMCHEFEVIHDIPNPEQLSAPEYEKKVQDFWNHFVNHWQKRDNTGKFDFDVNEDTGEVKEKLCGICLTKRIGYATIRKLKTHVLQNIFKNVDKIPSTTELALYAYFKREKIFDENKKREIAQNFHQNDTLKKGEIRDRYYAILLMDGDRMGKLVNGETIEAQWKRIMHPAIVKRIENKTLEEKFVSAWNEIFNYPDLNRRLLTPAIHASISEALGDFSIYHVARIVRKHSGRLIYAGGDDVCALLPLDTVLDAAKEIRMFYHKAFCILRENGEAHETQDIYRPFPKEKLSVGLGGKNHITISAGILICHHKEDLKAMIEEAHHLLDNMAKDLAGRDALAIELRKRSGGSRYFVRKWEDPAWEEFAKIGTFIKNKNMKEIASGLAYKLEAHKDGLKTILTLKNHQKKDLLISYIQTFLERSITSKEKTRLLAESIGKMIINEEFQEKPISPEALIVASFLMKKEGDQ